MGVKGLKELIDKNAPKAFKELKLGDYVGCKIAIDANISVYQFLTTSKLGYQGERTSHLLGMLSRNSKFLKAGIMPIYVFDGKPPAMKYQEILRRKAEKQEAREKLELQEAQNKQNLTGALQDGDEDDSEELEKLRQMSIEASKKDFDECKFLLRLMIIPFIQAKGEAEAQCCQMCKDKEVYAVASEDSDCFTYGAPKLLLNFKVKAAERKSVKEYDYAKVLEGLKLDMNQLIDLSILLGCDYLGTIEGIEGQEALDLIHQYGSIEAILNTDRYQCPNSWRYNDARRIFMEPVVDKIKIAKLKWTAPNEEGIIQYLVNEKNFDRVRVDKAIQRLKDGMTATTQNRLDTNFLKTDDKVPPKQKEVTEKEAEMIKKGKTQMRIDKDFSKFDSKIQLKPVGKIKKGKTQVTLEGMFAKYNDKFPPKQKEVTEKEADSNKKPKA